MALEPSRTWLVIGAGVAVALYLAAVLALRLLGRRENARALAGFVPDSAVLLSRLIRDGRISRGRAVLLAAMAAYLASPIDLIPDFIPGLGYLDDAVFLAIAMRLVVRDCSEAELRERWPGPESSLKVMLRLAGAVQT